MNKLLQTTLVSAIMATSGFATGDMDHEFEHEVEKAYEIKTATGYINPNFDIDPDITVNTVTESDLDFKSLTNTDLLYLGTDKDGETIKLTHDNAGPSMGTAAQIKYHIGDQGAKHSYGLELDGELSMDGNISNYRNGSIKITENADIRFYKKEEVHVPMTIDGSAIFYGGADIYKDVTVSSNGNVLLFGKKTTLKSGATWKICAKTDLTTE